ncbi:MAG TPA: amidohydrolase family protein [Candidatus Binatia bacterium]|nr:amidohydrolase family protein [Candidatus Binatia bacterium]
MDPTLVISADSHVVEPVDLWTRCCAPSDAERVPHLVREAGGRPGQFVVCEGALAMPLEAFCSAGLSADELAAAFARGDAAVRAGARDAVARRADMDADGVAAEVLYPSLALQAYRIADGDLQARCFAVYNDWLAELCAGAPDRLFGIGLISLFDPAAACREMERVARLGLRGAMVWCAPPAGDSYASARYEPVWAAARAAGLPISLHLGTTRDLSAPGESLAVAYMMTIQPIQRALAQLVLGGVLDRFPELRVVSVENEIGWLPHFLARLDHAADRYHRVSDLRLTMRPSEIVRRQVAATFQEDRVGVEARGRIGVECLMWASDYPHGDSTWPRSREVIARDLGDVPDDERRAIVCGNVARLYGISLP